VIVLPPLRSLILAQSINRIGSSLHTLYKNLQVILIGNSALAINCRPRPAQVPSLGSHSISMVVVLEMPSSQVPQCLGTRLSGNTRRSVEAKYRQAFTHCVCKGVLIKASFPCAMKQCGFFCTFFSERDCYIIKPLLFTLLKDLTHTSLKP
jgi:hypothetical protein